MTTSNPRRAAAAALAMTLLVAACSGGDDETTADGEATDTTQTDSDAGSDPGSDTTAADQTAGSSAFSCDEMAATFTTKGSANPDLADPVSQATCEGDAVVVTSNGIPDYTYIETSPGDPQAQDLTFTLPATPAVAATPGDIPVIGALGVAVNGVPIYGATEGTGGDVLSLEGALSECGSHNGPTGFHIHLFGTSDTTDCIFTPEEAAAAPQLLGFAFDGYPIYTGNDQYTSSWALTDESLFASDTWGAHTYEEGSGDLDQCNGRTDENGNYGYYTTDTFPYTLGCYRGEVSADNAGGGAGGPGPGGDGPGGDGPGQGPGEPEDG